jgi:hypothetical protein
MSDAASLEILPPTIWHTAINASARGVDGKFCDSGVSISNEVCRWVVRGNPLYHLASPIKLICDSKSHMSWCPHNIVINVSAKIVHAAFDAVQSNHNQPRPNWDVEVNYWADFAFRNNPVRAMEVAQTQPMALAAIGEQASSLKETENFSVLLNLISLNAVSLNIITPEFMRKSIARAASGPLESELDAAIAMYTWLLYTQGQKPLKAVHACFRNRIWFEIAVLGTSAIEKHAETNPPAHNLPVLPADVLLIVKSFLLCI